MNVHLIFRSAVYLFFHPKAKAFDQSINILAEKMPPTFMEISLWVPEICVSLEKMISRRPLVHVVHCKCIIAMRNYHLFFIKKKKETLSCVRKPKLCVFLWNLNHGQDDSIPLLMQFRLKIFLISSTAKTLAISGEKFSGAEETNKLLLLSSEINFWTTFDKYFI